MDEKGQIKNGLKSTLKIMRLRVWAIWGPFGPSLETSGTIFAQATLKFTTIEQWSKLRFQCESRRKLVGLSELNQKLTSPWF